MSDCVFVPAHEPWNCSTHLGGYRAALAQQVCSMALAEDIQPLTPAEIDEFDRWAESRRGKPASLGMLWALRLRATLREIGLDAALAQRAPERSEVDEARPEIVTLCGSTRFYDEFQAAYYDLTMDGMIVLSVGFYPHALAKHGHGEGVGHDSAEKVALDELHKRKIDISDWVYVINIDGYIGDSTRSEIEYAEAHGKPVRYWEPLAAVDAAEEGR